MLSCRSSLCAGEQIIGAGPTAKSRVSSELWERVEPVIHSPSGARGRLQKGGADDPVLEG